MTHRRDERGRLLPGQPALPGAGRPPVDPALRAETHRILQAATPDAARRLVGLVGSQDEKVALAASEALLSRVYGKPLQQLDAKIETTSIGQAHLRALQEIAERRNSRLSEKHASDNAVVINAEATEEQG